MHNGSYAIATPESLIEEWSEFLVCLQHSVLSSRGVGGWVCVCVCVFGGVMIFVVQLFDMKSVNICQIML